MTLTEVSARGIANQEPDIDREAAKLGTARPDLIILCQSAVGFISGPSYEQDVKARMQTASGASPLSAAQAMVAALRAVGATTIALATPFASGVDSAVAAYFARAGYPVLRSASLGLTTNYGIATVTTARLVALARSVDAPEVDAVVMPGGNLQAMDFLPTIEAELGKPVIITNQACIWAVAGILGVQVGPAFGRLGGADADGTIRLALRTPPA